jgi:prepilin-type N-terminal cleavage/methylation domain-containing protein
MTRRRGFTLLELMVSISILMAAFVILLPRWNTIYSTQMCNQAAQQMASDIRRMSTESLKGETYCYLATTPTGYIVYRIPSTYSSVVNNWTILKNLDFKREFGRVSFSFGGNTAILIGPKGWPVAAGSEPAVLGGAANVTASLQTTDGKGQYYKFTCSAGTGIQTYTVKLYTNGRVVVVSP